MPLAPLIVVALAQGRRLFRGSVTPLTLLVLVWLAVGFALIVAQRFSWWTYHFELLLWPLGLTAGIGAARLACWWPAVYARRSRRPACPGGVPSYRRR